MVVVEHGSIMICDGRTAESKRQAERLMQPASSRSRVSRAPRSHVGCATFSSRAGFGITYASPRQ